MSSKQRVSIEPRKEQAGPGLSDASGKDGKEQHKCLCVRVGLLVLGIFGHYIKFAIS